MFRYSLFYEIWYIYRSEVFSLIASLGNSLTFWCPKFWGKFYLSLKCKFLGTRVVGKMNNLVRLKSRCLWIPFWAWDSLISGPQVGPPHPSESFCKWELLGGGLGKEVNGSAQLCCCNYHRVLQYTLLAASLCEGQAAPRPRANSSFTHPCMPTCKRMLRAPGGEALCSVPWGQEMFLRSVHQGLSTPWSLESDILHIQRSVLLVQLPSI